MAFSPSLSQTHSSLMSACLRRRRWPFELSLRARPGEFRLHLRCPNAVSLWHHGVTDLYVRLRIRDNGFAIESEIEGPAAGSRRRNVFSKVFSFVGGASRRLWKPLRGSGTRSRSGNEDSKSMLARFQISPRHNQVVRNASPVVLLASIISLTLLSRNAVDVSKWSMMLRDNICGLLLPNIKYWLT